MLMVCWHCMSTRGRAKHRFVLNLRLFSPSPGSIKSVRKDKVGPTASPTVLCQELWDSACLYVKLPWKDEAQAPPVQASRKLCTGNSACLTMVELAAQFLHPVGAIFN